MNMLRSISLESHSNQPTRTIIVQSQQLLKFKSDILENIGDEKVTDLVLLDLSAAFDTVEHVTLLSRLEHSFGIT